MAIPEPPTILVAEDESGVRELVAMFLADLGYCVLTAADSDEAQRLLERHPEIDLLFTDVRLAGGETGFALARQARALRPDLKILYASAHIGLTDWPGWDRLEGSFLRKPFRLSDLKERIEEALPGRGDNLRAARTGLRG
jgi:CheY-like chemotaxis protein